MAKKIMLDAGHYQNYNKGAYTKYYEGNMTWVLQNYLSTELKRCGFEVGTTRSNIANDLSLSNRGAKSKGYDMFLSLHSNACSTPSVKRVVIIKGYDQGDTAAKLFGEYITDCMGIDEKYQIMTRKNSSGGEYYGVLRSAKSVGVANRYIIECGFHTNQDVAKWLHQDSNLKKLAVSICKAVCKYYGVTYKAESSSAVSSPNKNKYANGTYSKKARTTANLNLRKGRGTEFEIIKTIPKGTTLTVGYCLDNWFSTYDFGTLGYLSGDYIEMI